ncbi:MAG TPA: NUDIX domain-containing protein [Tepidiformaceae bacterium]|nr:NUDIX domain-containing protein [Tepidiformaceae bacterium]
MTVAPIAPRAFCPDCGSRLTSGERRWPECANCGHVAYRNPIVGVAMVVRDATARILVGRRAHGDYADLWCIPCGYVEWGEDVRDAAVRELAEETGLTARAGAVLAVHSNFHNAKQLTVGIWFLAEDVQGSLVPFDGEFTELTYCSAAAPPPLAFPTDALVLQQLAEQQHNL